MAVTRNKLSWTPVDVANSSKPIKDAFAQYEKARANLEAVTAASLQKSRKVPTGMVVKIGLMFNKLSYAYAPEAGSANSKAETL